MFLYEEPLYNLYSTLTSDKSQDLYFFSSNTLIYMCKHNNTQISKYNFNVYELC